MSVVANPRIRIRFSKQGKVRFTSHRDVARIWERALRRVALPVAYSEGFSPRPKISYGLALPTGYASEAEYLDVELDREQAEALGLVSQGIPGNPQDGLIGRLNQVLPVGIRVQAIAPVQPGSSSLQQAVVACTWEFEVDAAGFDEVEAWVSRVLDADEIIVERERKGKQVTDDVRPLVEALEVGRGRCGASGETVRVTAVLGTRPRALRPVELLEAMLADPAAGPHPPLSARTVCRMQQWMLRESQESQEYQESQQSQESQESREDIKITQGDARVEPLSVDAGPAALVETRV
ncbi:MAG: TIGR03936 family radical SAM-associated protein [Acidimicrobiales bacterium]|nr:hypothetical protein [Acidimicrobiaceae bacterium]MDP6648903.1 TIGR03936 family radical SAM-associated protein [Acidimicrobiales bacterium]